MKRTTDGPKLTIRLEDFSECPTLTNYRLGGLPKQISSELPLKQPTSTHQSEHTQEHSFLSYIDTPDFSRRVDSEAEMKQTLQTQDQTQNRPPALLSLIRQQFQCLKSNPSIRNELRCVDQLLYQIEQKLQDPSKLQLHLSQLSRGGFSLISKLNSQRSAAHTRDILYTDVNLCQLMGEEDQMRARKPSLLDLQNIDSIQYYKILYLLGESCDIASIRSRKSSIGCLQSSRTRGLNREIEMLDNVLKLKNEKISNFNSRKDESLKSTKRLRQSKQPFYSQRTRKSPLQRLRSTLISRSKDRILDQKKLQFSGRSTTKNLWACPYF